MEFFDYKNILIILAGILTVCSYFPYIKSILKNETKPHLYTWLIWTFTQGIAATALFYTDLGFSFSVILLGFLLCFLVFVLSFKYGIKEKSKTDLFFLFLAVLSILIWFFTGTPLYSVILISIVDGLGYVPTIRKTIKNYRTENIHFWVINTFVCIFLLLSLDIFSFINSVFLSTILAGNIIIVSIILFFKFKDRKKNYKN